MAKQVSDPAVLAKLNAAGGGAGKKVTDPGLLEKLHGDNYVHPSDLPPELRNPNDPATFLALPGTVPPKGVPAINEVPPSRSFGTSSSDTLNPLPAIAAAGDAMAGAIPIAGPHLQAWRDKANAEIFGGTPEQARADINKTVGANPGFAVAGTIAGKTLPYAAAAAIGGPIAASLGLEGSLGLRLLMGGGSSEAINFGDRMAHGEDPLKALGNATRDTVAGLPFFALGGVGKKAATVKAAPTVAEIKAQATPLYDAAEKSGLVISQPFVKNFVDSVASKAMKRGLDPTLTPKAGAAIKRLEEITGRNMSIQDAMLVREVLGNAATKSLDTNAKDHGIATTILKEFDGFLEGVTKKGPAGEPHAGILAGDANVAHSNLVKANKFWSQAMKGQMLDKAIASATARAATKDISLDKALRNEFGGIEQDIIAGDLPGFSPSEIKAIQQVAHGSGAQKLARTIGKLRSGGVGGIAGGAASGGWVGHLASGGNPVAAGIGATLGGMGTAGLGALGALGRRVSRGVSLGDAQYAKATTLGTIEGAPAAQSGRVVKTLPGSIGRSAVTMTLDQWVKQKQPQPLPAQ